MIIELALIASLLIQWFGMMWWGGPGGDGGVIGGGPVR